jgi:anti-sigma regulatory factor (Ser/Thr protein kinase)
MRQIEENSMPAEARSRPGVRFKAEWRLPSDPAFLPVIRAAVERLCAVFGWHESEARSITLALDEALTNVIRHAYHKRPDEVIELTCEEKEQGLEFRVSDTGEAPDPARICARARESEAPGGMGTHIIRDVMDTVDYQRSGAANHLVMTKRFKGAAQGS